MCIYLLLFNDQKWHDIYTKNCSLKTLEQWNSEGYPNVPIGVLYLTMGVIAELMYIPFICAMLNRDIIQNSCYKIMLLLAIFDMIAIPCDAILTGAHAISGRHFCTHPEFFYMVGGTAMGMYYAVCITCCILSIDRFLVMLFPGLSQKLFGGNAIFFWLTLPFLYLGLYTFSTPVVYNNKFHIWHFDPYLGSELQGNPFFYDHPFLIFNSFLTVIIMGSVYTILCGILYLKPKNLATISKLQKVMLLQSFFICFEMFFVATVYVANQWIPMPEVITKIEHIALICIHGDTPIIYLMLNATLRKRFYEVIKRYVKRGAKKCKYGINMTSVHHIQTPANKNVNVG